MSMFMKALRKELAQAFRFASKDPQRPAVNAVRLERDGDGWIVISTDGHRLRVAELSDDAVLAIKTEVDSVNLQPVVLAMMEGRGCEFLAFDGVTARSGAEHVRLVDETFPDYHRVIPRTGLVNSTPLVNADLLARFGAFDERAKWTAEDKRVAKMKDKKLPRVGCNTAGGKILVVCADGAMAAQWSGATADRTEWSEDAGAFVATDDVYAWKARDLYNERDVDLGIPTCERIALNVKYVLDALADTGDADLCWSDTFSPTVICGATSLHVIMPMDLSKMGHEDRWDLVKKRNAAEAVNAEKLAADMNRIREASERESAQAA